MGFGCRVFNEVFGSESVAPGCAWCVLLAGDKGEKGHSCGAAGERERRADDAGTPERVESNLLRGGKQKGLKGEFMLECQRDTSYSLLNGSFRRPPPPDNP